MMENKQEILKYAGYMAYIASHALTECGGFSADMVNTDKQPGDLTATKCRWLVREFNNNIDDERIRQHWRRLYNSVSSRMRVRVNDFFSIDWDEKAVLSYYSEASELMDLMRGFTDAVYTYGMDIGEVSSWFGRSKSKFREYMGRSLFVPVDVQNPIRASMPFDEGFPGRLQICLMEDKR